jgi:hypothetical protein
MAYDSGVEVGTIKDVIGHDEKDDTLGCIGINVFHMRQALATVRDSKNLNNQIEKYNKKKGGRK